jgi:hypothetical protein
MLALYWNIFLLSSYVIVFQICDSDLNILCVDPSTPGSAHDSNVWQSHPLHHYLNDLYSQGEEVFLLGM